MKQPNITAVLVHAAWADGSSWNKVTTRLEAEGFRVVSAQIPLTSFSDDVAALKRVLRRQSGRVVLVGHSYGGAVTTAAAADDPNLTLVRNNQLHRVVQNIVVYHLGFFPCGSKHLRTADLRLPRRSSCWLHCEADGMVFTSPTGTTTANAQKKLCARATPMPSPLDERSLGTRISHAGYSFGRH